MKIANPICAPSTVNWCENDYAVTPYIAEFWNTVTSIFILFSALYWYIPNKKLYKNSNQQSAVKIFWSMIVVSIGTCLFHGTLLYKYQLIDEMPMLVISMEYVAFLINLKTSQSVFSKKTIHSLQCLIKTGGVVFYIIPFMYFFTPFAQVLSFHITLKVFEISLICLLIFLSKSLHKTMYCKIFDQPLHHYNLITNPKFNESQSVLKEYLDNRRRMSNHIKYGIFFYSTSVFMWLIERLFCNKVEFLQLHAWWHILSSAGMYHLNMIITFHNIFDNTIRETNPA